MGGTFNLVLRVAALFASFFNVAVDLDEDMPQIEREQFFVIRPSQL